MYKRIVVIIAAVITIVTIFTFNTVLRNSASMFAEKEKHEAKISKKILEGARNELKKKTEYLETYEVLDYPGGDVDKDIGVCTDLVIRSYRNAGIDLQQLLHEDRVKHAGDYPTKIWSYKNADKNIDHRRCQNLFVFFRKFATSVSIDVDKNNPENNTHWQPGDVVFFKRDGKEFPWHVGIISDTKDKDGLPNVIDLNAPYIKERSLLEYEPFHSHFRWKE